MMQSQNPDSTPETGKKRKEKPPLFKRRGKKVLAASRARNFEALLAYLDPDVLYRTDALVGSSKEIRGAVAVAKQLLRRAQKVQPILVNGSIGIAVALPGQQFLISQLTITDGKIAQIDVISDPIHLSQLRLSVL